MAEKTSSVTKKDKQKTDETRNNLGKAWMKHKDVCARSLQEFVNHLLAVHEVYCTHIGGVRPKSPELEPGEAADASPPPDHRAAPENSEVHPRKPGKHKSKKSRNNLQRPPPEEEEWERQSPARSDVTPVPPPKRRKREAKRGMPPEPRSRSPSFGRDSRSPSFEGSRDVSPDVDMGHRQKYRQGPPMPPQPQEFLGICITSLPLRSTDTSLKDGLYHEYKKYGKVTSVTVTGETDNRTAIVSFKKPDEAAKACEVSQGKVFFGASIQVELHEGFLSDMVDEEDKMPDKECDEYGAKATRTLYIRNLENDVRIPDLRDVFQHFGEILEIDIKKQGTVSKYAFIQYSDITSVVRARQQMDDEYVGGNKIKTGFGKSMPTKCVWLGNIAEPVTEKYLMQQFSRFGVITHVVIDRSRGRGLVYFEDMDCAQLAVDGMRGRVVYAKRIQTDFASRACETALYEFMERTGQVVPGMPQGPRPSRGSFRGGPGMQTSDRYERYPSGGQTGGPRDGYDNYSRGGGSGRGRGGYDDYEDRSYNPSMRGGGRGYHSSRGNYTPRGGMSRGIGGERKVFPPRGGYSDQGMRGRGRGGGAPHHGSGGKTTYIEYMSESGIVHREERLVDEEEEFPPYQDRHHSLSPPVKRRSSSRGGATMGGETTYKRPRANMQDERYSEKYERYPAGGQPSGGGGGGDRYRRVSSAEEYTDDGFADSDGDDQPVRRRSQPPPPRGPPPPSSSAAPPPSGEYRRKPPSSSQSYPPRRGGRGGGPYRDDDDDDDVDERSDEGRSPTPQRSPSPEGQFSPDP